MLKDNKKMNLNDFIGKARSIHGNKYDYSKVIYINGKTKVIIICPIHGEFKQMPKNHLQGKGCKFCKCTAKSSNIQEFTQKARKIHGNRYGYGEGIYINSYTKLKIICPIHGEFFQEPRVHLSRKGCPNCVKNKKMNHDDFIKKAKKIHGDRYDYSKVIYINWQTKITIICPVHGEFEQTPNKHLIKRGCPRCSASKGEVLIASILKTHNINFIQEYKIPNVSWRFRYDFYLPNHNLLIEFHGGQHYKPIDYFGGEEGYKKIKERDKLKKVLARECRIPLLEFNYKHLRLPTKFFENFLLTKIKNNTIKI